MAVSEEVRTLIRAFATVGDPAGMHHPLDRQRLYAVIKQARSEGPGERPDGDELRSELTGASAPEGRITEAVIFYETALEMLDYFDGRR